MKSFLSIVSLFFVMQVSRESLAWAFVLGVVCLVLLLWHSPSKKPQQPDERRAVDRYEQANKISREQDELINKGNSHSM